MSAVAGPLGLRAADLLFDDRFLEVEVAGEPEAATPGSDARRRLELWERYSREEVHDVFDPTSTFQAQRGDWGNWGFISVRDRPGDFVFFVTFGARQGDHDFDESISDEGVLVWQSQPGQTLRTPRIQTLIRHDERINNIYLFLRTKKRDPRYTYLGKLGYLEHDPNREKPVYFRWQLLDGLPPAQVVKDLGIELRTDTNLRPSIVVDTLTRTDPPEIAPGPGAGAGATSRRKQAVLPGQDARNRRLGLRGEKLVLLAEAQRLRDAGLPDLAARIEHVSVVEGDGAGYDIRSYNSDGSVRFIEVKTTRGPAANAFYASPNEIRFSEEHASSYVLVRVYAFDDQTNSAMCYELPGALADAVLLAPSEFRATLRPTT